MRDELKVKASLICHPFTFFVVHIIYVIIVSSLAIVVVTIG